MAWTSVLTIIWQLIFAYSGMKSGGEFFVFWFFTSVNPLSLAVGGGRLSMALAAPLYDFLSGGESFLLVRFAPLKG